MPPDRSEERTHTALATEGYQKSIDLMRKCSTEHGFVASPNKRANYHRIWGRDSGVMGLAALHTGDTDLIDCCRRSLETLAANQGPHGEIPSNVDARTQRVSYGGTAGRVDADLWFAICCAQYWQITGDDGFLERMLDPLEKIRFLLGAWEYNARGLIYIPPTGDWADEYVQSGYVLYDQLLYLQVQREFAAIHRHLHDTSDHQLEERITRLVHLIRANYWFWDGDESTGDAYHQVLYEKGRKAAPERRGNHWMPFFSPVGYGYRFDGMANALVSLLGVADETQSDAVDEHIADRIVQEDVMLIPAFHPVITPKDEKWRELQMTFSHTFKNQPHEYHNGGLWPMVTAFYAASLARRGKRELALEYLNGVHHANRLERDGQPWSFPEYLHGQTFSPGGTSHMGWNAAAAILAHHGVDGKTLFERRHEGNGS